MALLLLLNSTQMSPTSIAFILNAYIKINYNNYIASLAHTPPTQLYTHIKWYILKTYTMGNG